MGMGQLHVVFLPFIAHGHMIPVLHMAKLFASRGVRATIISTPAFAHPIRKAQESGADIGLSLIKFPPEGSDLPDNFVSLDQILAKDYLFPAFLKSIALLQPPVEKLLQELRPNCLVADMFLPWTTDSAAKFGIPRLAFSGFGYFASCATEQMKRHKPYKSVSSDSEPFLLPNLPHRIKITRSQVSQFELEEVESDFVHFLQQIRESEKKSYGVVVNSFFELESDYADHYKNVLGGRAWHIGPLLLQDLQTSQPAGKKSDIHEHECMTWLDSKKPDSVVYACFGTIATFTAAQLHETAIGLEASGQDFIWVVRKVTGEGENEEFLPEGYEERVKGKGLIIRGWAPQVQILNHPSVGAFVTHCGWNSTLEGVCAGLPLVTWPVFAEQFLNEKLVTEILRIGVAVGNRQWRRAGSDGVPSNAVAKAVRRVMVGDEAVAVRNRAKEYRNKARMGVEEGGSSYNQLSSLLEELGTHHFSSSNSEDYTNSMSISGVQGQVLEITVVGCIKLKDTEWIARQDPYVCLEYGGFKNRTRTCTDGGKNPTFQEKFVITLIEGLREMDIAVWNSNTVTFDDFIGSGKVQLHKVVSQGYDDSAWPIQDKRRRHAGEVKLIMHYPNAKKPATASHASSAPPPPYAAAPPASSFPPPPTHYQPPPPVPVPVSTVPVLPSSHPYPPYPYQQPSTPYPPPPIGYPQQPTYPPPPYYPPGVYPPPPR